jgi:hypothetical protein
MLSRKRIIFVLALIVSIFVSPISLATPIRKHRTVVAPLKMRTLRHKDNKQDKPPTSDFHSDPAQPARKLRVRSRLDLSLEVKEVRNLQSDTWYKDLEIEVKNVSQKPIYLILAGLTFPDPPSDRRLAAAINLGFGLPKYIDIRVVGNPLDPHVKPGQTCVLKIGEYYWDILRRRQEKFPERFRSFGMGFNLISFGDQTGVTVNGPEDHRKKPNK